MRSISRVAALAGATLTLATSSLFAAPVELWDSFTVPFATRDGLLLDPPVLEDGTPHDLAAAFGSGLTYTGVENLYLAAPDRGPADGTTSYRDRMYLLRLPFPPQAPTSATSQPAFIVAKPLTNELGEGFTGNASAFTPNNSPASLRLDVEGIRVGPRGTFFVSDEYGPFVYEFDAEGRRLRVLTVPDRYLINTPMAVGSQELPPTNTKGRQANRGMEGLAISPDGAKLFGVMQNALIQDGALNATNSRRGLFNRILEIDIATGATRDFVYELENRAYGVNDLVAVNGHQLLAIERDGNPGVAAAFKKIFLVELSGATDASAVTLPQVGPLPVGVIKVTKTLLLDLLDPAFALAGATFPEKIESLAFAPDLADGRHLLLVANDNDFLPGQDTRIWAFAIAPTSLPGYLPQGLSPELDVRPGKFPNRIDLGGGSIEAAVLGNGLFAVEAIDRDSLELGGAAVRSKGPGKAECKVRDDNRDGIDDLVCKFEQKAMTLTAADTTIVLTGRTTTGTPLRSTDAVEVR